MKILKIRTLEKGWRDKDSVILHAAFQLLVDFVQQEKPDQVVDWSADAQHRRAWKDIRSLYEWWTRKRPSRRSPLDAKGLKEPPMRWKKVPGSKRRQLVQYDKKKYAAYDSALKKHWRLEAKWDEEDQTVVIRLFERGIGLAIDEGDFERAQALCDRAIALGLGKAYEARRASIERMT